METLARDIRYAGRMIARKPFFALVIVTVIGLGVGANSAIFSVVNGVLLEPLPYPGSERITMVWEDFSAQGGNPQEWIEVPNFFEWKRNSRSFQTLSAFRFIALNLVGDGEPRQLLAGTVSYDFLDAFQIKPLLGRGFSPDDDVPESLPTAILSYDLWQRVEVARS